MMNDNPFSFWRLLLRSLIPSSASIITSSVIAFLVVGVHLLLLSMDAGSLWPQAFGGATTEWGDAYSKAVLSPIESVVHNDGLNTLLVIFFWGFVGWAVYAVISVIVGSIREIQSNQQAVYVPSESQVIHHPLRRLLIARLLWRLFIIMAAILVTLFTQPLLAHTNERVIELMKATDLTEVLTTLAIVYVGWIFVLHLYVICLRLFLFRTRVFGEIVR